MPEALVQLQATIVEYWESLSPPQKMVVVGIFVSVIVALIALTYLYSQGPAYEPLFSNLGPQDASAITEILEEQGIPYHLTGSGDVIEVPSDRVHATRISLAAQGLPSGGVVGFEIFDQTSLGTTDFVSRINYVRALEGELTRTIVQLRQVKGARVHIVLPEPSLFAKDTKPSSAAVLLQLVPGARIEPWQVQGIMHLLVSSVEGLEAGNVTVIDHTGTILSAGMAHSDGTGSTGPGSALEGIEVQRQFEGRLQASVQTLLEQVFGTGNVLVRVTAELSMDQRIVTKDLFEPVVDDEGIIRSMEELQEFFQGTSPSEGGVPGVDSNIPGYDTTSGGEASSQSETSQTSVYYEINEIQEHIVVAPGSVKRLSVAVVLNQDVTEEQRQAIRDTVAAAIGFDTQRNDQINVTGFEFNQDLTQALLADLERSQGQQGWGRWAYIGAGVLLALAVAAFGWRAMTAGRNRMRIQEQQRLAFQQQAAAQVDELNLGDDEGSQLKRQLEELIRKNPAGAAQLLKTWILKD